MQIYAKGRPISSHPCYDTTEYGGFFKIIFENMANMEYYIHPCSFAKVYYSCKVSFSDTYAASPTQLQRYRKVEIYFQIFHYSAAQQPSDGEPGGRLSGS